ncbi:MAG: DUF5698 domain-containing protein [Acetomicrobium sp.]
MTTVLGLFFIFFARMTDVSMGTFRILLLVRGMKLRAALIGFCEVSIYIIALSVVLGGGKLSPPEIVFYAGGFAAGNYLGAFLEEKLLSGYALVEVIAESSPLLSEKVDTLREAGYGTTVLSGRGKNGERMILKIVCERKKISDVLGKVKGLGFVYISDVKSVSGGFFSTNKGK